MYNNKLNEMTRGWFVGNFEPSVYKTNDVEVSVRVLERGYSESAHFHRIATKIIVVLYGTISVFGKEWGADDIIIMEPGKGDATSITALEESKVLMILLPGVKNDKVYIDLEDTHESSACVQQMYTAEEVRKLLNVLGCVMNVSYIPEHGQSSKSVQDYVNMQKRTYENSDVTPEDIVGQYEWHEEYPYETFLLYKNGDLRKPIFENTKDKTALDFACGPGRMVKRMMKLFKKVDGCDISERLIQEAKYRVKGADFYVTNGNDLGDVPLDYYDYIYCTISMQHIASYEIRKSIMKNMNQALKASGKLVLQMAYNPDFPYVRKTGQCMINNKQIIIYEKDAMADYFGNDFDAQKTNGLHDVGIGKEDLLNIKEDLSKIFSNVEIWFSNVSNFYNDLNGQKHSDYWATDWIYLYAEKNASMEE